MMEMGKQIPLGKNVVKKSVLSHDHDETKTWKQNSDGEFERVLHNYIYFGEVCDYDIAMGC